MKSLGDFLLPLMKRMNLYEPARDHQAIVLWPEVVGPFVQKNTAPVAIRGGILFVRTSSSAWMTELSVGFRTQFIAELNRRIGTEIVKDIRFLPPPLPPADAPDPSTEELERQPLTTADEQFIEEVSATVESPEARNRLRRIMRRDRALRRARVWAGWKCCPQCEVLTKDGGLCATCGQMARRGRIVNVRKILMRAPWTSPLDLKKLMPDLTMEEYERVKGHILRSLKSSLQTWHERAPAGRHFNGELLGRAMRYCMLRYGKRPAELTREEVGWALGRVLAARVPD